MDIKERLEAIAKEKGIKKAEFQREIGVSPSYINNIVDSISAKVLSRIKIKYPDINPDWIITGNGEMHVSNYPTVIQEGNGSIKIGDVSSGNTYNSSGSAELLQYYKNELERYKSLYDNALKEIQKKDETIMKLINNIVDKP